MDPTNPRWESSEVRYARAKVFWSVIVSVVAAAALTTVFVASCLNRGQVQRDATNAPDPSSMTETTGATTTTIVQTQPAAAATTIVIQQPVAATPVPAQAAPITNDSNSTDPAPRITTRQVQAAPPAVMVAPPTPRVQAAPAGVPPTPNAPITPTTSPQGNSTEVAPTPTQGAGAFTTDAPPNGASSFKENPEAGAGAFPGPQ